MFYTCQGGSINVQNWVRIINDKMPPEPVRDLKLLTAVDGSDMFTIGWTAAGDDPGQGTGKLLPQVYFRFKSAFGTVYLLV